MAITDKKKGVWGLDQVYNKKMQGSIWQLTHGSPLLFAWGRNNESNSNGDLGLNDGTNRSSPTQLPGTTWNLFNSNTYGGISIQGKTDGTLWMWGLNRNGSLAQNTATGAWTGESSPVQIPGTTWSFGSGGGRATKTDGTMWVWGGEYWGTLGLNQDIAGPGSNFPGYSSPVQLPGAWATGRRKHTNNNDGAVWAIKDDGTLWAWGHNGYGELAQNNTTNRSSPIQIGSGTDWNVVMQGGGNCWAAGAIKTDGSLWTWGRNSAPGSQGGWLGHNNTTTYSSPVQIPGTWENAHQGNYSSMGVKTDGTLWAWGRNGSGELGQNDTVYQSSPVQIPGTNWGTESYHFAAAHGWMAALKTDGTLWGWGANFYGTLNNNNTIYRSSPTQIPGLYDQIAGIGQGILARQTGEE
tara:strand:+ start:31 stop:1254 length:1224 start_codon:yes stop_codon:yes gene_type:complete